MGNHDRLREELVAREPAPPPPVAGGSQGVAAPVGPPGFRLAGPRVSQVRLRSGVQVLVWLDLGERDCAG